MAVSIKFTGNPQTDFNNWQRTAWQNFRGNYFDAFNNSADYIRANADDAGVRNSVKTSIEGGNSFLEPFKMTLTVSAPSTITAEFGRDLTGNIHNPIVDVHNPAESRRKLEHQIVIATILAGRVIQVATALFFNQVENDTIDKELLSG